MITAAWKTAMHYRDMSEVRANIARFDLPVEIYQPTILIPIYDDGRLVTRPEPLFFNYIFVRETSCELDPFELPTLLPIHWVIFGNEIATVSDELISTIEMQATSSAVETRQHFKSADFGEINKNKTVEIIGGAFGGTYGTILGAGPRGAVVFGNTIRRPSDEMHSGCERCQNYQRPTDFRN